MAALSPALRPGFADAPFAGAPPAGGSGGDCVVAVRGYTRIRNGRPEEVSGYQRSNPDCGNEAESEVVLTRGRARTGADQTPARDAARQAPPAPARAWEGQPNQQWREQIAAEETQRTDGDFGYGARNPSGALGRYQLQPNPLWDARWRDEHGNWTVRARAAGVSSEAEFLANPAAQEAALTDVMGRNEDQLRARGAYRFVGQDLPGLRGGPVPVTESGLAAAAHREGARTVSRYLEHRAAGQPIPAPVRGRGDLSRFNEVERRLRAFAVTPYERVHQ
ncbi:hypothetical protein [Siccirubricoccus phaeus]|uniref:hypothetical protein n=1 Tax=Siccirubricoccus phaeus TaxID=2595053 RepID=UPI0011F399D7|nr:hypothetical protein [Siccirubricoccus phaeus]